MFSAKWCGGVCPFSLGLALGITYALASLCMGFAMMHGYVPHELPALNIEVTWALIGKFMLWGLIKGFIFGAVLALLYNLFSHYMAKCCSNGRCQCCIPEDKKRQI